MPKSRATQLLNDLIHAESGNVWAELLAERISAQAAARAKSQAEAKDESRNEIILPAEPIIARVTSLVEALETGNLPAVMSLITHDNINAIIPPTDHTALSLAAKHNHAQIVDYLLSRSSLDLQLQRQGQRALIAAINVYDKRAAKKSQALLRILSNRIFQEASSYNILPIHHPDLERAIVTIKDDALTLLFKSLVRYQVYEHDMRISQHAMRSGDYLRRNPVYENVSDTAFSSPPLLISNHYQERLFHFRVEMAKNISDVLTTLQCSAAAQRWSNTQVRELNEMLMQPGFVESCHDEQIKKLLPVMELLVEYYRNDQFLDVLQDNGFMVFHTAAYCSAFMLGRYGIHDKSGQALNYQSYLHDALEIYHHQANSTFIDPLAELMGEPQRTLTRLYDIHPQEEAFLKAYTSTHSRYYYHRAIASEQRLSKHLDYLVLLQPALTLKSHEARAELENQKDFMPKLLGELLLNPNSRKRESASEIDGLKYFYGINVKSDMPKAIKCFERAAVAHEPNSVNKSFNAYLLLVMALYQQMVTTHLPATRQQAVHRALTHFKRMLTQYVPFFPLTYQIEVFELLFDYIKKTTDTAQKNALVNVLCDYLVKLAGFQAEFKEELVNHIFQKLIDSKLLNNNLNFKKITTALEKCVAVNGMANIFYKKFDLLALYPAPDSLTRAQRELALMKARIHVCQATINKLHDRNDNYDYAISILSKAMDAVQALPVLAAAAGETIHMKRYSDIYVLWGETHKDENERYDGFKKAIELNNSHALMSLLEMPAKREYQVSVLRGLQNAIHANATHIIKRVHTYLTHNGHLFTATVKKLARLAVHANSPGASLSAASKGYLPELIKLFARQKQSNHVRRSLYLSTLLLAEFVINKQSTADTYHYSEAETLSIMKDSMIYLCEQSNPPGYHQYIKLAVWYMDFITAAQAYVNASEAKIDINTLMLYCARQDGYYGDVHTGMRQSYTTDEADNRQVTGLRLFKEMSLETAQQYQVFYNIMRRNRNMQKVITLHHPNLPAQPHLQSYPHQQLEMVTMAKTAINQNRHAFFAERIASVKPVVAEFKRTLPECKS